MRYELQTKPVATLYTFLLTGLLVIGDVVAYVATKQIPDIIGNATLIMIGACAGISVPAGGTPIVAETESVTTKE